MGCEKQAVQINLGACGMLQVLISYPVHLPSQVIPRMNHFVCHRVFHVLTVSHLICTYQDAMVRIEAAGLAIYRAILLQDRGASTAMDVGAVQLAIEVLDLVGEESNYGGIRE